MNTNIWRHYLISFGLLIAALILAVTLGAVFHLPMEVVSTDKTALPA